MRLSGSLAVLALVNFFFMPVMRRQNASRRAAFLGDRLASSRLTGGLSLPPVARLYEARPLAFSPPSGFLPSLRCQAGLAITCSPGVVNKVWIPTPSLSSTISGSLLLREAKLRGLLLWILLIPKCLFRGHYFFNLWARRSDRFSDQPLFSIRVSSRST